MRSTRPIKVLHVCTLDITAKVFLATQLRALGQAGYEVHVACSPGPSFRSLIDDGFRVHGIRFVKHMVSPRHLQTLIELYRLICQERYDIVHVHNIITAVLGRIAAKLARVPIVLYTLHGFYFHENMSPSIRWANVLLERFCGRFTDFILSQADEDRRTAITERIIAEGKVLTIGNGVDICRFSDPERNWPEVAAQVKQELGIPPAAPVIGTVGRIVQEKGFQEFCEAAVQLVRHCPEAVFLIVGDTLDSDRGKFSMQLRSLIRANHMESKFFFTGFRLDTERFYPAMDVFVLPSYREGMPRTVIEAMAAARPVVATNIRGCREEVVNRETGYLIPVRDAQALAEALLKLLGDPTRARQMGQVGQQRAQELFDEQLVCERIVAVYQRIVEERLGMREAERNEQKSLSLRLKRIMDCLGAAVMLVLLSPVMALIALLIKLDSRGPILFRQVRAGLEGRPFTMYKFRTMVPGAEQGGLSVLPSDPRVTRVGHWLRSFSLDELPQLIHILKGDMSLVGPRPLLPEQVERMMPIERRRLRMSPGLTNLPALYGRNWLTFDERLRLDVWYVEHWSLWLDLKILLKTPWIVLRREGVYTSPEAAVAAARRQVDRSAASTPSNTPYRSL